MGGWLATRVYCASCNYIKMGPDLFSPYIGPLPHFCMSPFHYVLTAHPWVCAGARERFTRRPNMIKSGISQCITIFCNGQRTEWECRVTYGGDRLLLLMPPVQLLRLLRLLFSPIWMCVCVSDHSSMHRLLSYTTVLSLTFLYTHPHPHTHTQRHRENPKIYLLCIRLVFVISSKR